jgi:hypothetical protein
VARFREIEFWPRTGHSDRHWTGEPVTDAWVKSARRVSESYGEALRTADLVGPVGSLRFMTWPSEQGADGVRVEVPLDRPEGWESGLVWVPHRIVDLSPAARGRLVADVVHAALRELAPHRGWPVDVIDAVHQRVLDGGPTFSWASPWKASPSRKLQARAFFRLADDGYGRVVLEIRERQTERLLARSDEEVAYSTPAGFERAAATLTWSGDAVGLVASVDLVGEARGELHLDAAEGVRPLRALDVGDPADDRMPALTVTGTWAIPEEPSIRVIGGGPTNGVPDAYLDELSRALETVERDCLAWWAPADRRQLEIWYVFEPGDEQPTTRRTKDKLIARIHRDSRTMRAAEDPAALARADVRALLEAVGSKMGLGAPPDAL